MPHRYDQRFHDLGCHDVHHGHLRKRFPDRVCEICEGLYSPTYPDQRTCGRECGDVLRRVLGSVPWPQTPLLWRLCRECNRPIAHPRWARCLDCRTGPRPPTYRPRAGVLDRRVCPDCHSGFEFVVKMGRKPHRCPPCQTSADLETRRKGRRDRRAREANAPGDHDVDGRLVLERDSWVCRLCGEGIDRDAIAPAPWSASIDHVIPLARGGEHSMANVQAAHYWCNSVKSDGEFSLAM